MARQNTQGNQQSHRKHKYTSSCYKSRDKLYFLQGIAGYSIEFQTTTTNCFLHENLSQRWHYRYEKIYL